MPNLIDEVNKRKAGIRQALEGWAKAHLRRYPWRENRTPYKVLVSEFLLRRTTASAVLRMYEGFIEDYPTLEHLAAADEAELENKLETIGYHKQRAKMLINVAKFIAENYKGKIPNSAEKLLEIPHVGPYISGAILSFGYGIVAAIVDSNIYRIYRRVFLNKIPSKNPIKTVWVIAEKLVPDTNHELYNYGLLDLGALVCRYDRPQHAACPLKDLCDRAKKEPM